VDALLRVIEQLQATNREYHTTIQRQEQRIELLEEEIRRLKGLPEPPKRPPQPSPLNDPSGPPSASGKKKPTTPDGKRSGSAKRSKTPHLVVHDDVPLPLDGLPDGTKFLGYQDFTVQDLRVESHNTRYRRGRYQLPDRTIVTAPLPKDVTSHFGPTLRQFVLYQHFHNHVTQPLLHEELLELGVDISAGQVNRLLTERHEAFHEEKDDLLPAAREVSTYLQTDDTSARHRGKGGHTLHIGNDLFASFFTTETKSRVNFLKILLAPHPGYLFNGDALFYLECFEVPKKLLTQLQPDAGWAYEDDASWEAQLDAWKITSAEQRRLVTEGALWANLLAQGLYSDLQRSGADQRRCRPVQTAGVPARVVLGAYGTARRATDPAHRRPTRRARSGAGRDLELLPATEGLSGIADAATTRTPGKRLRPVVPEEDGLAGTGRGVAEHSRQEVGVVVGSRTPGNSAAQQPVGE
jgi:hypothetical protein